LYWAVGTFRCVVVFKASDDGTGTVGRLCQGIVCDDVFHAFEFEGNWKYVLLAPTTILAIGLPIALFPDIGSSYYTNAAPQVGVWAEEVAAYEKHHAEEAEASGHGESAAVDGEQHAEPATTEEK